MAGSDGDVRPVWRQRNCDQGVPTSISAEFGMQEALPRLDSRFGSGAPIPQPVTLGDERL